MKLRFTPRAMNDLTAIRRFIRDEYGNPKAAKRITDSIFAQCTQAVSPVRHGAQRPF